MWLTPATPASLLTVLTALTSLRAVRLEAYAISDIKCCARPETATPCHGRMHAPVAVACEVHAAALGGAGRTPVLHLR